MEILKFDTSKKLGKFKYLNAVNNGPSHKRHANDQYRSNLEAYKEARIPYARNHDAAFYATYGGEHTVDITAIFPNFDADAENEASYDFTVTDEYILVTLDAGTKTFYRLGQKIEHYIKKFGTLPPKDFKKWAVICEHIIRHYNEGWANGFKLNIEYWEIWNEPDMSLDDSKDKLTWGGTKAQFFDLYEIAAKHLKKCFPNLLIGGPALCARLDWAEDFLMAMKERNVPIDFFSWHVYCTHPVQGIEHSNKIKQLLIKYGYENAQSILDEWNYVSDWGEKFVDSIKTIIGIKGAAFSMAFISEAQKSTIDMLMYYDARPCVFNGLFDFYTFRPLKGYYPFKWYGMFYDTTGEIRAETTIPDIFSICGCLENDKVISVLTYYTDNEDMPTKTFKVDFGKESEYEFYLLDNVHDAELIKTSSDLTLTMAPNTCIMIKEK